LSEDKSKTPKIDKKPFFERFKDNFRPTPISNADETLFDVCMKCGVRLPDKKLTTLKEHQNTVHPLTAKEKRSAFMYKHMLPVLLSFMAVMIVVTMVMPSFGFDPFDLILESIDEPTDIDVGICTDRTIALKTRMYEQGAFLSSDADDFDYLLQNCKASFWSYKYGDTLFESDYYSNEKIAERNQDDPMGTRLLGE